jgi:4-amino-4-deoxy-L-arabinose transferase-like glycosyltransferase
LLALAFAIRAVDAGQPIVENYVGRQVPTAMVARNLDRGSGFLRPQLDTGPFPSLFLVEPPVFASAALAVHRGFGVALEPAGRIVSALAVALGAWGLYGLVRRREGPATALLAAAALAIFPVTIRYGRAFQPDALMLGTLLAGLRCWDDCEHDGGWPRLVLAWSLTAISLAVKVTSAYVLVPLVFAILRPRRPWKVGLVVATLGPALLWYGHAWGELHAGLGSGASAENAATWGRALASDALIRPGTWVIVARYLVVRAFTPVGFLLACWGLFGRPGADRLWRVWCGAACAALAVLAGKLHHEYYWLALAPVAAVGVARAVAPSGPARWVFFVAFAVLCAVQSISTWRTPPEWEPLGEAADAIRRLVPREALVVAPEAVLYAADRRGCRLEDGRASAERAAREWGGELASGGPLALVEFYAGRGARFVADVYDRSDDPRRRLHDAIRSHYRVLVDRPGVLLAELTERGGASHAER